LKLRGIVTSWSSEQQDAMSKTARREAAPKGVRLREGSKALKGNPMSGTDPRGRKALEGVSRQEGEKP